MSQFLDALEAEARENKAYLAHLENLHKKSENSLVSALAPCYYTKRT